MKGARYFLFLILIVQRLSSTAQHEINGYDYNVLYYPFEGGVQMVSIRFGLTLNFIVKRTLPPTDQVNPTIYLFRDTAGHIIRSYGLCGSAPGDYEFAAPGHEPKENMATHREALYSFYTDCEQNTSAKYIKADMSRAKAGAIDTKGNIIIPPTYDKLTVCGNILVVNKDNKSGVLDLKGNALLPVEYEMITFTGSGWGIAYKDNKRYYLNAVGKIINKRQYQSADYFWSYRARVMADGKFGYIDTTGAEVIPLRYEHAREFYKTIAIVGMNNKYGLIDNKGKIVQPIEYDELNVVSGGLELPMIGYKAVKNGKEYFFDDEGLPYGGPDVLWLNNGRDTISLAPIAPGGTATCAKPEIVRRMKLNGKKDAAVVILRRCVASKSNVGETYDMQERWQVEQYEVWDIPARKLLFTAVRKYEHQYHGYHGFEHDLESSKEELCTYDVTFLDNGEITIGNIKTLDAQPDKEEGTYVYSNGVYLKK